MLALAAIRLKLNLVKILIVFAIIAFAFFAAFRGFVGTDTHVYLHIISARAYGAEITLEPGFIGLMDAALMATQNPHHVLAILAAVFFSVILFFTLKGNRDEVIYLIGYCAPHYFLNYSMNGLRIGMASAFILIVYYYIRRSKMVPACIFGAIAFSFHFTSIVAIALLFFAKYVISSRRGLAIGVAGFAALALILVSIEGYLSDQFDQYSGATPQGNLAGLSGLFKIAALLALAGRFPNHAGSVLKLTSLIGALVVLSYLIAFYSYAGIRFMDIILFVAPLMFLVSLKHERSSGLRFRLGMIASGLVGTVFVLRNIYSTEGAGLSPFLPYHFFWDL